MLPSYFLLYGQPDLVVAIENGMTTAKCIEAVADARRQGLTVPVVFMGYTNPFFIYGEQNLIKDTKAAGMLRLPIKCFRLHRLPNSGVDGFIVVDYPPEAATSFIKLCAENDMSFIPLVAPTTSDERLRFIDSVADSFIYCVSLLGVTGARNEISPELVPFIERVRKNVSKPIAIGFGVSTRYFKLCGCHLQNREIKDTMAKYGEGVVVGSSFIKTIAEAETGKVAQLVQERTLYFTKDTQPVDILPACQPHDQKGIFF